MSSVLTKDFEIHLSDYQEDNLRHVRPLSFLQCTPFIERLKVDSVILGQELPLTSLNRLHTLELDRMQLTEKDVTDITLWAPQLKHLTLSFCTFIADHLKFEKLLDQYINLPQLALETLTLKGIIFTQALYISLTIASSQSQLFYAAPYQPIVRTTWEESRLHAHRDAIINIKCKHLKHLSVNLGHVTTEMEFDDKGNVVESEPAITS